MKLSISTLLSTIILPLTSAAPMTKDLVLLPRAPIHRQTCSGDYGGTSIGVLVCCDIDFSSKYDMVVHLSVRDSKADSSDVYGWCVVTDSKKKTHQVPGSKLRNSQGAGTTLHQYDIKFSLPTGTAITYVSARGCVDKAIDQCADWSGRETINPF